MLSALILENFKAFGRRQVIRLAPITLIFGANSSGKSSILQSLLLLKQTLAEARSNETLLLAKGDLVDLGSFREMVFGHEVDRVCEITPMLAPQQGKERLGSDALWPYRLSESGPQGIGIRVGYDDERGTFKLVSLPSYLARTDMPAYELVQAEAPSQKEHAVVGRRRTFSRSDGEHARFVRLGEVTTMHPCWADLFDQFTREFRKGFADELETQLKLFGSRVRMYVDSDGRVEWQDLQVDEQARRATMDSIEGWLMKLTNYDFSEFIGDVERGNSTSAIALRNFILNHVSYSWPRRHHPEFAYRDSIEFEGVEGNLPEPDLIRLSVSLSQSLEEALDDLLYLGPRREIAERHYIFGGNAARDVGKSGRTLPDALYSRPDLVEETNQGLRAFQVGYQLQVHRISDAPTEGMFALLLVDEQTGIRVGMMDVGFGVWQVLPVIVESLAAQGTTVLIEEPEIHLHPRLQANLGNLLMRGIAEPRGNQFIIETHSEHLILRIQRLIREGKLKNSDVSVVYVMKGHEGSTCQQLRLDEEGDFIDDWPGGFFEEGFRERFG